MTSLIVKDFLPAFNDPLHFLRGINNRFLSISSSFCVCLQLYFQCVSIESSTINTILHPRKNLLSCIALRISEKSTSVFCMSGFIHICVSSWLACKSSLPSEEIEEIDGICDSAVENPDKGLQVRKHTHWMKVFPFFLLRRTKFSSNQGGSDRTWTDLKLNRMKQ